MGKKAAGVHILAGLLSLFCLAPANPIFAASTNSWTSTVTAAWESLSWSLGVRPDISQAAIMITNYGQKTIILGATARDNYPGSLVISNLTLAGTSLSTNTLLLNFTGTSSPLRVFNSCTIQSNAVLLNLSGALDVVGSNSLCLIDGGTLSQDGGSNIFEGALWIGNINSGQYNSTNGATVANVISIGGANGGLLAQYGGTLVAKQTLQISGSQKEGLSTLSNGTVQAGELDIGLFQNTGEFIQHSGSVLVTSNLNMGEPFGGYGRYTLESGSLQASNTFMGDTGRGDFIQTGGTHSTGLLAIGSYYPGNGSYTLSGGVLNCDGISLEAADFSQTAGTNFCRGEIYLANGSYQLSGGELHDAGIDLEANRLGASIVAQTGGNHIITNALTVSGQSQAGGSYFFLSGGSLQCGQFEVDYSSTFEHTGGAFTVQGPVRLAGGTITATNVTETFGPLLITSGGTSFDWANGAVQHFAASANQPWAEGAVLVVGGGTVYFGNTSSGLTAHQLLQIFLTTGGPYARLDDNGQLIGWPVPPLDMQVTSTNLVINWKATWENSAASYVILQSADRVEGPYTDVPNASTPYTIPLDTYAKFFRLRTN